MILDATILYQDPHVDMQQISKTHLISETIYICILSPTVILFPDDSSFVPFVLYIFFIFFFFHQIMFSAVQLTVLFRTLYYFILAEHNQKVKLRLFQAVFRRITINMLNALHRLKRVVLRTHDRISTWICSLSLAIAIGYNFFL